ncbi:MAG: YqgE/AlgH family protein [Thiotrichaceae bacterium]|nr:YqgE/AlgH family protein [Thiotrichaceae bacterium]
MSENHFKLQNQLLIAMPGMSDPQFEHNVILVARHTDQGCFGLCINQPSETNLGDLFEHLNIDVMDSNINHKQILKGGPVQPEQGFILHDSDQRWENTLPVSNELAVTASKDILKDIADNKGPSNFLLILGCASWTAGQIEAEMLDNVWLTCPVESNILFEVPFHRRWKEASKTLGVDVSLMTEFSGHA